MQIYQEPERQKNHKLTYYIEKIVFNLNKSIVNNLQIR